MAPKGDLGQDKEAKICASRKRTSWIAGDSIRRLSKSLLLMSLVETDRLMIPEDFKDMENFEGAGRSEEFKRRSIEICLHLL